MASVEKIFGLFQKKSFYQKLGKPDKALKVNAQIRKEFAKDKNLLKQYEIIVDVVDALDGSDRTGRTKEQIEKFFKEKGYHENVFRGYQKARSLLDELVDYAEKTFWTTIGPHSDETYVYKGRKYQSWQYQQLKKLRERLVESKQFTNQQIEAQIQKAVIRPVEYRKNYYPHIMNGTDIDGGSQFNLLNEQQHLTIEQIAESIKDLNYWKERTNDKTVIDRNLFGTLSRRSAAEVNTRWVNTFRSAYNGILKDINEAYLRNLPPGGVDLKNRKWRKDLETLSALRGVTESMYKDISSAPQFRWMKSMGGILRGAVLSNLLLLSPKANIRNFFQGILPNIQQFGIKQFRAGQRFLKDGATVIVGGKEKNILRDLGIERADIFSKAEGAQEWDVYKTLEKVRDLTIANQKGGSAKVKAHLKNWVINAESFANKYMTVTGSSNIFILTKDVLKKSSFAVGRKVGMKLPIPEWTHAQLAAASYRNVEIRNRERTAAIAFIEKWKSMVAHGAGENEVTYLHALQHARNAINKTQFNYNMWNRPKAFRRFPNVFQFKSYTTNMMRLHWSWLKELKVDPVQGMKHISWSIAFGAIIHSLEEVMEADLWGFFEVPEFEWAMGLYDKFWGSRKEREDAWYGSRTFGIGGPVTGLLINAMVVLGMFDVLEDTILEDVVETDETAKEKAFVESLEMLVPGLKEFHKIDRARGNFGSWQGDYRTAIADYLGVFRAWEDKDSAVPKIPNPYEKKRYKGFLYDMVD